MREKIWYELTHIKVGEYYLSYYLSKKKRDRHYFKIATLIFSAGGIMGWSVWDALPIIACGIVSVIQLLGLIENQIIITDEEVNRISRLRKKYSSYFNELEKLWIRYESKQVDEAFATQSFFELRSNAEEIEDMDNKIRLPRLKRLYKKADSDTRDYLNQYHS